MQTRGQLKTLAALVLAAAAAFAPAHASTTHYEARYVGSTIGLQCRASDPDTPDVGGMCREFSASATTATFTVKDALLSDPVCADLYFDITFTGRNLWAGKFCGQTTVAVPEGTGQFRLRVTSAWSTHGYITADLSA